MSLIYKGQTIADVGGSGGGGSSEEIYSTEEVRIGTWIDGKPIYRKVFVLNKSTPQGAIDVAEISSLHLDSIVKVYGASSSSTNNLGIFTRFFPSTEYVLGFSEDKSTIKVYCGNSNGNVIHYFALEYTKTTDEATS